MKLENAVFVLVGIAVVGVGLWLLLADVEPPVSKGTDERAEETDRTGPGPDVAEAPVRQAEVVGVVRGPDGRPYEGARVVLLPDEPPSAGSGGAGGAGGGDSHQRVRESLAYAAEMDERDLRILTAGGEPTRKAVDRTTSGPDGRFLLPLLIGRRYRLTAAAEGLFARTTSPVRAGDHVVLDLRKGTTLAGLVRAADGNAPLGGVSVGLAESSATATTSGDGTFDLGGLTPGPATVVLRRDGYATLRTSFTLAPGGSRREFVLDRGITVDANVEIWGDDDEPAVGATVALLQAATGELHRATTDAKGNARLEHLAPGRYDGVAHLEGAIPHVEWGLRISSDRRIEFMLEREAPSLIRVLGPDGRPVPDARFLLPNVDDELDVRVSREVGRSDEDGRFRFAFDEDRRSALWVTAAGFAAGYVEPDDPAEAEEITLVLRHGAAIEGRVTDGAGNGIAGAVVLVESYHDDADEEVTTTVLTDDEGKFRADGLLRGGEADLEVSAEGFLPVDEDVEFVAVDGPRLEIVLRRGAEITGRVVDGEGLGVADVRVTGPGSTQDTAATASDGSFRLGAIRSRAARAAVRLRFRRGDLVWDADGRVGQETVVTMPAEIAIGGRVVAGEGDAPVTSFVITVRTASRGTQLRREVNHARGVFETVVPDLPGVTVTVMAPGMAEWTATLDSIPLDERAAILVRLESPPTLVLEVKDTSGNSVLGARVILRGANARWSASGVSGSKGIAKVAGKAGDARVLVTHPAHTGVFLEGVRLEAGRETRQEVRLPAGGDVRVRVTDGTSSVLPARGSVATRVVDTGGTDRCILTVRGGSPLSLEVEGPGAGALRYVRPRVEEDHVVLRGLPAGAYRIRARSGVNRSASVPFQVGSGSSSVVSVVVGR